MKRKIENDSSHSRPTKKSDQHNHNTDCSSPLVTNINDNTFIKPLYTSSRRVSRQELILFQIFNLDDYFQYQEIKNNDDEDENKKPIVFEDSKIMICDESDNYIDPDTNFLISDQDDNNSLQLGLENQVANYYNLIKQLPNEIILNCMFYMEKETLGNFIWTCRDVFRIFDEINGQSVERLRLDILNGRRKVGELNLLLDLFSNSVSEQGLDNVMMTYDQYFRTKSPASWPSSYFHDRETLSTVYQVDDPIIKQINETADLQMSSLNSLPQDEISKMLKTSLAVFPYGLFPQKDGYYLTFEQFVRRRCVKGMDKVMLYYLDKIWKLDRVITPDLYQEDQVLDPRLTDYHIYVDKPNPAIESYYLERLVRFFKHPYKMTFSDFDERFKNIILSELARILIYDCVFEYNRTTKSRERFVVSGGSLLHTLTGCGCQDIDIFIINNGEPNEVINQAIKNVMLTFEKKSSKLHYNIMSSKTTINICQKRPRMSIKDGYRVEYNQNIQIVLLKYDSIEELLLFFDLDCCKLAFDGSTVFTVLECLRALKYKINFLSKENGNSEINHERASKYGTRGFHTYVLKYDHPLAHAMHCDFIVESHRMDALQNYYDAYNSGFFRYNTSRNLHVSTGSKHKRMNNPLDLDESTYLYPLVLRNVDFHFIELCIYNGLSSTLHSLLGNLSKQRNCFIFDFMLTTDKHNSGMVEDLEYINSDYMEDSDRIKEVMKIDEYIFVHSPSELFQVLPEHHDFVKNKYSDMHLARKYQIVKCEQCLTYLCSPTLAEMQKYTNQPGFDGQIVCEPCREKLLEP